MSSKMRRRMRALIPAVFGIMILSVLTAAPRAEVRIAYSVYIENNTELYLKVNLQQLKKEYGRNFYSNAAQTDVPPVSTRNLSFSAPPGDYRISVVPVKCGGYRMFPNKTYHVKIGTRHTNDRIILYDTDFGSSFIGPQCPDRIESQQREQNIPATERFAGSWTCPGRGWMKINQTDTSIWGKLGGEPGEAFGKNHRRGGSIEGKVVGDTMEITMKYGDETFTTSQMILSDGGKKLSGAWQWYDRYRNGKGSGTWSCHR